MLTAYNTRLNPVFGLPMKTCLFMLMNENRFKKADKNPLEIYYNDYRLHPEKKCKVDICIPVEE